MTNQVELSNPSRSSTEAAKASARGVCFWYQSVHLARATASCRYRIGNFVELTRGADVVIGERLPSNIARRAHTVVCVRPFVTPSLQRTLSELGRKGIRLIADYDDLLFAGDVTGLPASAGGSGEPDERRKRLDHYAAGLQVFDEFIVSTRKLAEHLTIRAPRARVTVVPNGLSAHWVAQGRALYPSFQPTDMLTVRYFSGSPSHDRDAASILPALREFLVQNPQVHLELVGHLQLDTSSLPQARVSRLDWVDYDTLPRLLSSSWVNIAPLLPSEFGACKSAIKFLEAAAFGCPTLASPNDDMLRHKELGAPVVICETGEDWLRGLDAMLDPQRRATVAAQAQQHVATHAMARTQRSAWLGSLAPGVAS